MPISILCYVKLMFGPKGFAGWAEFPLTPGPRTSVQAASRVLRLSCLTCVCDTGARKHIYTHTRKHENAYTHNTWSGVEWSGVERSGADWAGLGWGRMGWGGWGGMRETFLCTGCLLYVACKQASCSQGHQEPCSPGAML